MRIVLISIVLACAGCARFTEAQIELVDQAKKGMELCRSAVKERAGMLEQYFQLQRGRLDEAFAADVRERQDLSPEWVIEHQKAYSAAVSVLERQRAASLEADAAAQKNFDAVADALGRLLVLQGVQRKFSIDGLIK